MVKGTLNALILSGTWQSVLSIAAHVADDGAAIFPGLGLTMATLLWMDYGG